MLSNLGRTKLETFNLTPKDQIPFILNLLDSCDKVSFEMIFKQPSLNHFVITLLAVLRFIKKTNYKNVSRWTIWRN